MPSSILRAIAIASLITLSISDSFAQEEYTRNDSLLVQQSRYEGSTPFFGYTDLDISGDFAIGGGNGTFTPTAIYFSKFFPLANKWEVGQVFSFTYFGPILDFDDLPTDPIVPKIALSGSTAVFSVTDQNDNDEYYNDYYFAEKDENDLWNLTDTISLVDFPDSTIFDIDLFDDQNDLNTQTLFGIDLDLQDDFFAVTGFSSLSEHEMIVLIFERLDGEWVFKEKVYAPSTYTNEENNAAYDGIKLKFLDSGELALDGGRSLSVFALSEGNWTLTEQYEFGVEDGIGNFTATANFLFARVAGGINVYERTLPLSEPILNVQTGFSFVNFSDAVSDNYFVVKRFSPVEQLVVYAYDEEGWSEIDSPKQNYFEATNGNSLYDITYNSWLYVREDKFVTVDYNTFSAYSPNWYDISTTCRAPKQLSFDLTNDGTELTFGWFTSERVVASQLFVEGPYGFSGYLPDIIFGKGQRQYSRSVSELAAGTYQVRVRSLCRLEPYQLSGLSGTKTYNLLGGGNNLEGTMNGENTFSAEVFPNPSDNAFNIQSNTEFFTYSIYDISGRLIEQGSSNGSIKQIQTSHFTSGQYFLEVTSGINEVERIPFLVNH